MHLHHTNERGDADENVDAEQEWKGLPDDSQAVRSERMGQQPYESTPPTDHSDRPPEDDLSPAGERSAASSVSPNAGAGDQLVIGGISNATEEVQQVKNSQSGQDKGKARHLALLTWTKAKTLAAYGVFLEWENKLEKLERQRASRRKANKKHYETIKAKIANGDPEAIAARKKEIERQRIYSQDVKRKTAQGDKEAQVRCEKRKQSGREAQARKKTTQPGRNAEYRATMVQMAAQGDENARAWLEKGKEKGRAGYWRRKAKNELYPWEEGYVDRTASSPQNHSRLPRSAPDPAASHWHLPERPVVEPHWPADQNSMIGIHDRREESVDVQGTGQRRQEVNGVQIDQGSDWYTTDGDTTGSLSSPISPRYQGHKGR